MGSLVSGIYDLFAGNPTAGEQKQFGDLANYESGQGEKYANQGLGWESDILSGDPTKIAQALAPEIKAGQQQVQQTAEQGAMFGNRGGGTNATTQGAQSNERGNIINLVGGLQSGAAGELAGAGQNLLGMAPGNLTSEAGLATQNQQRVGQDIGGIATGAAEIAMPFLGGMGGGFGGFPTGMNVGTDASGNVIEQGGITNEGYDPGTGAMTLGGVNE